MMQNCTYIAVKVDGLKHWLWFKTLKVTEKDGRFIGLSGWGKDGNYTEIDTDNSQIIGRIYSDSLHY